MKKFHFSLVLVLLASLTASPAFAGEARLVTLDNDMIKDTKTGLIWQLGNSPQTFDSQEKAAQYAGALDLGGKHDWRLPTLAERWELLQIFVFKNNGAIEFPKFDNKYWTAETDKGTQPIKLDITCMCRGDKEIEYKNAGYVRAVRGQQSVNQ